MGGCVSGKIRTQMKKALITGITGQDGSFLAELLLDKGYEVHGLQRRSSSFNTGRIDHIFDHITMHFGDMTDSTSLIKTLDSAKPDEIYNLAAQSHVRVSFDMPVYSADTDGLGVLRLLEAAKTVCPKARIYQAGSSEMYGSSRPPQNETTVFHPRSPYGCAKVFAHNVCVNYRESYGMHVSNGILFNHESERRGETFVTRKIAKAAARIKAGLQKDLILGNLDSKRDWGYAADYVRAMWLMLQQPHPGDYVVSTGETHSIRDFLDEAFTYLGLNWKLYVTQHERYYRPAEVDVLLGDYSKAHRILGWEPRVNFKQLVRLMVKHECEAL
jgi:GDPmannose 4,6-dehydratase